jgi:hypothetical protein
VLRYRRARFWLTGLWNIAAFCLKSESEPSFLVSRSFTVKRANFQPAYLKLWKSGELSRRVELGLETESEQLHLSARFKSLLETSFRSLRSKLRPSRCQRSRNELEVQSHHS